MLKLGRVSSIVTRRHFRRPLTKKFVTLKYVPSIVENIITKDVDIEKFVKDVIIIEGITLAVKIAIVMFNIENKKYMYEDVSSDNTEGEEQTDYECHVSEDDFYDCREVLQDWDEESEW